MGGGVIQCLDVLGQGQGKRKGGGELLVTSSYVRRLFFLNIKLG